MGAFLIVVFYILIALVSVVVSVLFMRFVIGLGVEYGIKRYMDKNKNSDLALFESYIVGAIINSDNIRNNKDK